jgi:hypothetical protein
MVYAMNKKEVFRERISGLSNGLGGVIRSLQGRVSERKRLLEVK